MSNNAIYQDAITGDDFSKDQGVFLKDLERPLINLIQEDHPNLSSDAFISNETLANYRLRYLNAIIDNANTKNDNIRELVVNVSKNQLSDKMDVGEQWNAKVTFGQKIADAVARFGGSWTFIICFVLLMIIWMALNVIKPFGIVFDAYPFILLNLALSTIAAIQAPLIMMSQNRASDYDRLQARNDFLVNQKSEEEIKLLHEKLDHLVQQDQSDLLAIQKLQTEMLLSMTEQLDDLQKRNQELLTRLELLERKDDENDKTN